MNKTTKKPGKRLSAENIATGKRLLKYIMDLYKYRFIMVFICILLSAVASISVSLSLKYLLDDFIIPLIGQKSPNYTELYRALTVLGCIFLVGVIATFTYTRMMVYIGQGVLKKVRDDMFEHMQTLPIRYFDQNTNGSIMSLYTNDIKTDDQPGYPTGTDVIFHYRRNIYLHARAKPASYRSCSTHHRGSDLCNKGYRRKQWKIFHPSADGAGRCDWIY